MAMSSYARLTLDMFKQSMGIKSKEGDEKDLKNPNSLLSMAFSIQAPCMQMQQKITQFALEAAKAIQDAITGKKSDTSKSLESDDSQVQDVLQKPEMKALKDMQDELDKAKNDLAKALEAQRLDIHKQVMEKQVFERKNFKDLLSSIPGGEGIIKNSNLVAKCTDIMHTRGQFGETQKKQIEQIVGDTSRLSASARTAQWDAGTQIKVIGKLKEALEANNQTATPKQLATYANILKEEHSKSSGTIDDMLSKISPNTVARLDQIKAQQEALKSKVDSYKVPVTTLQTSAKQEQAAKATTTPQVTQKQQPQTPSQDQSMSMQNSPKPPGRS